ncbi:MAG: hypothetical protein AVDCRST_MAG51-1712 [uncultured Ramlibacter sp.]|uniref:Uncharacterized protein n=1 Tax=uncultured Ramlibacter sp. TaxID=260755 RepID=A0A6J4PG49_9BURK|nr:MAG: hypothetical protein AVDCRST_MAG51-1712 [uncultured Ramlibacter sp.]
MQVVIRSDNVRLPRAHALGLADRIRGAFARLAHRIERIVVRVAAASRPGPAARECTVEIHLPNGEVAVVTERQRRLGALLRRATERACKAAAAVIARHREDRPAQRLVLPGRGGQP